MDQAHLADFYRAADCFLLTSRSESMPLAAAAVVLLFTSTTITEMTNAILMLLPLVAINFFVHGRYLVEKPVNRYLLVALSAIDIAIITLISCIRDWNATTASTPEPAA